MDDGGIVGSPELLQKVWDILKAEGPCRGLQLNPTKCEWSWLNPECTLPCPLPDVALVPTGEIQMLGVPLGADDFVEKFVENKLLANSIKVMSKLAAFDDTQSAMYLLRLSCGIVRANHFMRTTPVPQWKQVASKFDTHIRDTVSQILGTTFPGDSYAQACISTKIEGLGIRRVVDHANGAFAASWHESQRTAMEAWNVPPLCNAEYVPQMQASASTDAESLETIIARASPRDAQRLRRNDVIHANAWISSLPSSVSLIARSTNFYIFLFYLFYAQYQFITKTRNKRYATFRADTNPHTGRFKSGRVFTTPTHITLAGSV